MVYVILDRNYQDVDERRYEVRIDVCKSAMKIVHCIARKSSFENAISTSTEHLWAWASLTANMYYLYESRPLAVLYCVCVCDIRA
jgi:hypothetical protein